MVRIFRYNLQSKGSQSRQLQEDNKKKKKRWPRYHSEYDIPTDCQQKPSSNKPSRNSLHPEVGEGQELLSTSLPSLVSVQSRMVHDKKKKLWVTDSYRRPTKHNTSLTPQRCHLQSSKFWNYTQENLMAPC